MVFRKIIFFYLVISASLSTSAQISHTLKDSIHFTGKNYQEYKGKDIYDNYYFLKEETLIKTNLKDSWEYTNLELGVPTSISTLNPLQILVFYQQANTFVLLDRFLTETRQLNLNTLSPSRVAIWVENAKNREVWLYNSLNNELEFFNYQTNTTLTENLIINNDPLGMVADFNSVYLLFDNKIKQYNNYGTLLKEITIVDAQKISLSKNKLVVTYKNKLELFNKQLNSLGYLKKPKNSGKGIFLSDEKLYIYRNSSLFIYQLTIPTK